LVAKAVEVVVRAIQRGHDLLGYDSDIEVKNIKISEIVWRGERNRMNLGGDTVSDGRWRGKGSKRQHKRRFP